MGIHKEYEKRHEATYKHQIIHPGLAENTAPDGGPGSDIIVVDHETREIMHLVASVCLLNRLTYDQSKVFVCMSVIRGCIRIITRMRSIGY